VFDYLAAVEVRVIRNRTSILHFSQPQGVENMISEQKDDGLLLLGAPLRDSGIQVIGVAIYEYSFARYVTGIMSASDSKTTYFIHV
jgi:hypothetical protein